MPIYEYRCESCGEALEKIQKFSDAPLVDCPACGKSKLKKLVSASSFRLKGSGWYETDFKHKKKPGETGKSSADKSGDGESGNSTGESRDSKDSNDSKDSKESKDSGKDSGDSPGKKSAPGKSTDKD